MENELLRDVLLVIIMLAVFIIGFFVMKYLDKFLKKNYKPYKSEGKKTIKIVDNENSSDEETLLEIKKVREKGGKIKIIVSDEDEYHDL